MARCPAFALDRRRSSWVIVVLIVAAAFGMMASPTGAILDRLLMPLRFAVTDRSASGKIAIVEMDAASAGAINRWPWPRSNYARVVDRLRQAGAASIVLDIDFSSASDEAGDAAFAAALDRAEGRVVLPTFGQFASSTDRRTFDALPIPMLRNHATLASVSIRPDPDGQVRNMTLATITQGTPRPSLSAYIAARSGMVGQQFPIDMSINPFTIPRFSFVAIRDGRFDPAGIRGRDILVGATAIEMGDRYGTPHWGVIPGVVVQALSAETLLRGVPVAGSSVTMLFLATLLIMLIVSLRSAAASLAAAAGGAVALTVFALVAQYRLLVTYPIATALTMIALAAVAVLVREVLARFSMQRLFDEPTGLPNARALLQSAGAQRSGVLAAVQIINYDALCAVLGASASADVIIRVGERIALISIGNAVYRTAGHQLAFFLSPDQSIDDALDGLRVILLQPLEIGGRKVDVHVAAGVASDGCATTEHLLTDATLAAEAARASDVFWCHATTNVEDLERSIGLMGELDEGISSGQIEVFYQPKYNLRDRTISSVEALVRWRHPDRGFIGPDLFIPVAEKSNRIAPLTLHVLSQVVRDVAIWRVAHPYVTAAINISAKLLSASAFNADVERILAAAAIPTAALVFEVTESAAMSDIDTAITALRRYRALGIEVSMDDYGTGQSTLTYLRQLPLNELKIDRSFVQFAHKNRDDGLLVRSTIDLAHQLGLKVVAEGVEDRDCLEFLDACGCDLVQGYLISKPVPLDRLQEILGTGYRDAA